LDDIAAGTAAGVDQAFGAEFFPSGKVVGAALALEIRAVVPSAIGAFIPMKAKPAEIFIHGLDEFRFTPGVVQILDS